MTLTKITRSRHRKSYMAVLTYTGYRVMVYVGHNVPGTNKWGDETIVCHTQANNGKVVHDRVAVFSSYQKFRNFKKMLS